MNLQAITVGIISAVNPQVICTIRKSTGYTVSNFKQVPTYALFPNIPCQLQPLSNSDLKQVDGLNLQGVHQGIWINGGLAGVVRVSAKGGDVVITPDEKIWLVVQVLEEWVNDGWCHAVLTLQDGH